MGTKGQWTKGPWKMQARGASFAIVGCHPQTFRNVTGILVATADGPSADANARLIAGAPELADTSTELADAIAVLCPSDAAIEHASLEWKRVHAALKPVRAALKKAGAA